MISHLFPAIFASSIFACAHAGMEEVRVDVIDEIKVQLHGGAQNEDIDAHFRLYAFEDHGGTRRDDGSIPGGPRTGFALSASCSSLQDDPRLLWSRHQVLLHIPSGRGWEPIRHDLGAMRWDEAAGSLWVAVAITTNRTSMIEVHEMPMSRDPGTNLFDPIGEEPVSLFRRQIRQPGGEADRVISFDIHGRMVMAWFSR